MPVMFEKYIILCPHCGNENANTLLARQNPFKINEDMYCSRCDSYFDSHFSTRPIWKRE